MNWEDPDNLLIKKLGREEYCQRMLTSLIVGGPYPRWNTVSIPSEKGVSFLERLYELTYGNQLNGPLEFVDEYELQAQTEDEKGGAPDLVVIFPRHFWIIELKTETSSHRKDQLPLYLRLAQHHHPSRIIEILYLSPEMHRETSAGSGEHSFAHLFWSEVSPLIGKIWKQSDQQPERILETALQREFSKLDSPAKGFRDTASVIRQAIEISRDVQESGEQRAIEVNANGLDEIIELRIRIRDALQRLETAKNVQPWVWYQNSSGGRPLTNLGKEVGCELRLSRYS